MSLTLQVVRYQGATPAHPVSVSVNQQPVIIGRRPDCDLLLADPERFISSQHAQVSWNNGAYYLADTSTNGTYINHAETPVGQDGAVQLNDGDEITIGDYDIQVHVSAATAPEVATIPPAPQDPFGSVAPPPPAAPPPPDAGMSSPPFAPPPLIPEDPVVGGDEPLDPLQLIDGVADEFSSPGQPWPGAQSDPSSVLHDVDHAQEPPADAWLGQSGSVPDDIPADQAYFAPPQAIPEDWDVLDDTSEPPPPQPAPQPAPVAPPQPEPPPAAPVAAPATPATPPAVDADAARALLAGLGLEKVQLDSAETARLMQLVGELLREMTTGVMRILANRASLKNQMRMDMTTIKAAENNPLKFSSGAEDALNRLLINPGQGYLPPRRAVREAIDDLQVHELALMAGLRAALTAQFERLAPQQVEQRVKRSSLLGSSRKAHCWEQYITLYKQLRNQAEDDALRLAGDAFMEAYEAQVRQIGAARDKGDDER